MIMTEKQRNLIIYLDSLCREKGIERRATDDDLLGEEWWINYTNVVPDYASMVINELKTKLGMPINEYKKGGRKRK